MKTGVNSIIPDLGGFHRALLGWYRRNRRDLPWRRTQDPYAVWVSEIMLQQTRVTAVADRYVRFLKRFPSVEKLAAAREATVLAEWSGLGYYRRARNLHASAKAVVLEHAGGFPRTAASLRKLPGIGRYTAAAIASIAFGEAVAVVDGNVERVLSRLLASNALFERQVWSAAQDLLCRYNPGDFNQAMMELGATVCLPAEPNCAACPVKSFCRTQGRHARRRRNRPQVKRQASYALCRKEDSILLVKREQGERLMPGMWELPQVELRRSEQPLFSVRHSITVTDFTVHVVSRPAAAKGVWIKESRLKGLPLTGLTKKILGRAGVIQ